MRSEALGQDNQLQKFDSETEKALEQILRKHKTTFKEELGTYTGPEVHIRIDAKYSTKFCKALASPVPFAQREALVKELERLEREGIPEPMPYSYWVSPVVRVGKEDGSLWLCGDYSSVNPALRVDQYLLRQVNSMFTQLLLLETVHRN